MKISTLSDLFSDRGTLSLFFGSNQTAQSILDYEWLSDYFLNSARFDKLAVIKYGSWSPLWNETLGIDREGVKSAFHIDCVSLILKKAREYQRIWEALTAEYNPIENYNRTETMDRDTTRGGGTDTETRGGGTDSTTTGDTIETINTDERVRINSSNPFDADNFVDKEKEHNLNTIDTNTIYGRTDSVTTAQRINSMQYAQRNDTEDYTLKVHGNIGVMTNVTMINEELSLRTVSMWDRILSDIISELCFNYDMEE